MEAVCINVDNSGLKGIKVFGLTKGKKYQVKQSKEYDNYFDLENDFGIIESYKKERFEVMEDKIIKVRCINAKDNEKLKENKIYTIKKEYGSSYSLEEIKQYDYQFDKNRFEKVEQQKEDMCSKDSCKDCDNEECRSQFLVTSKEADEEKGNKCYNEECKENNKNGVCLAPKEALKYHPCIVRYIEKPILINYEEEYKKLKEESEDLRERLDNQAESIGSYIKENETFKRSEEEYKKTIDELKKTRDYLNKANVILEKEIRDKAKDNAKLRQANAISYDEYKESLEMFEEENKRLKKEIEELKQRTIMPDYRQENDMLRCQYEEAQKVANSFEIMADKNREKQKAMESDLIKYESTIKTLKGIIKNISEVL